MAHHRTAPQQTLAMAASDVLVRMGRGRRIAAAASLSRGQPSAFRDRAADTGASPRRRRRPPTPALAPAEQQRLKDAEKRASVARALARRRRQHPGIQQPQQQEARRAVPVRQANAAAVSELLSLYGGSPIPAAAAPDSLDVTLPANAIAAACPPLGRPAFTPSYSEYERAPAHTCSCPFPLASASEQLFKNP